MNKALTILCFASVCTTFLGCSEDAYTGAKRYAVSGMVTVDDKPMPAGVISFLPQGEGRVSGAPIRDGTYTIPEEKGVNAGTYRVEIHWSKPTGRKVHDPDTGEEIMDELEEGLPDKYHKNSELSVDVSPDQTTFDFDLASE
jgi:hypothetical protein